MKNFGQMFGLKLLLCLTRSNSDVTLGAFFKWLKCLHSLLQQHREGKQNIRAEMVITKGPLVKLVKYIHNKYICILLQRHNLTLIYLTLI